MKKTPYTKEKQNELDNRSNELKKQKLFLIEEKNRIQPKATTKEDSTVSTLKNTIAKLEDEARDLENRKAIVERRIDNIKNGSASEKPDTPVEKGSQQAKTHALREVEKIEANLELAEQKIATAEKKKQDLEKRIRKINKKGTSSSEVQSSQNEATAYAVDTAKKSSEYKDFQKDLHQKYTDGAITWDTYSEKIQAKIDEIVARLIK